MLTCSAHCHSPLLVANRRHRVCLLVANRLGIKEPAFDRNAVRHPLPEVPIMPWNRSIPWSKTLTYLGINIDRRLTFASHIRRLKQKANLQLHRLYPILRAFPADNHALGVLLFNAFLRPILPTVHLYGVTPH